MELSQLRSLVAIVGAGNFSRAAVALHLSQPALTHQIHSLEEELGAQLLERGPRQVRLTPQGDLFLTYAHRILSLSEEGLHAVRELSGEGGRITLAAGTTNIVFRLPDWLQKLRQQLPRMEISVRAGSSLEVMEAVLQDRVDLGLVTSPVSDRRLARFALFQDEIFLVAGPNLALEEPISWTFLNEQPFLLFPKGSGFRKFLDDLFRRVGIEPRIAMELDNIEGLKQMAGAGMGMTFLPRIAVQFEVDQGFLRRIHPEPYQELFRTTSLILRKEKVKTPAITEFIRLLSLEYPSSEISRFFNPPSSNHA